MVQCRQADRQTKAWYQAHLDVGIDGGCINNRPADHSICVHDRHGHEAIDEGPRICLLEKHTDGRGGSVDVAQLN